MATALSGIRVAAFTHFAAGPIAAQYLGSFGADVIKVESPQQDVNRAQLLQTLNRRRGAVVEQIERRVRVECCGSNVGCRDEVSRAKAPNQRLGLFRDSL
jgi:CoA-transferase family III